MQVNFIGQRHLIERAVDADLWLTFASDYREQAGIETSTAISPSPS